MVFGKLLFGFILGNIASTLANAEVKRVKYEEKLGAVQVCDITLRHGSSKLHLFICLTICLFVCWFICLFICRRICQTKTFQGLYKIEWWTFMNLSGIKTSKSYKYVSHIHITMTPSLPSMLPQRVRNPGRECGYHHVIQNLCQFGGLLRQIHLMLAEYSKRHLFAKALASAVCKCGNVTYAATYTFTPFCSFVVSVCNYEFNFLFPVETRRSTSSY